MRTSLRTSDGRPQELFDDDRSGLIWKASAAATASPSYVAAADRAEGTITGRGTEAGKKRPAGDKAWAATSDAVHAPAMNPGVKW